MTKTPPPPLPPLATQTPSMPEKERATMNRPTRTLTPRRLTAALALAVTTIGVAVAGGYVAADQGALPVVSSTSVLPERYLRLEGINTAQGNAKVLVELYRVAFDPLKEISFISDEYNKFELEGSLLADTTKPYDAVLGQFGRIVQL